jgi:hypothetical protein
MRVSAMVLFRVALIFQFALGIVGTFAARSLHAGPASSFHHATAVALDAVFWGIDLAAAVGMCFFRRWARALYITLLVLFAVALLFRGRSLVGSTISFGLFFLENILDGVVIAMAFLPPLAGLFAKRKA